MSKWFEVKVTLGKTMAVEVADHETKEDAIEYAKHSTSIGNYSLRDFEIEAGPVDESHAVDSMRRLADEVLPID